MKISLFVLIYRLTIVGAGLLITYLGYTLFKNKIFNQSGDIELTFKKLNFSLKNSTPGTMLIILGIIVVLSGYALKIPMQTNDAEIHRIDSINTQLTNELETITRIKDSLDESCHEKNKNFTKQLEKSKDKISNLLAQIKDPVYKNEEPLMSGAPINNNKDSIIKTKQSLLIINDTTQIKSQTDSIPH